MGGDAVLVVKCVCVCDIVFGECSQGHRQMVYRLCGALDHYCPWQYQSLVAAVLVVRSAPQHVPLVHSLNGTPITARPLSLDIDTLWLLYFGCARVNAVHGRRV